MATESYWNLSFGTVLEASLHFILEEELVVLAVLEQQLFDTDFSFWNYLKVPSGSGQTARNFVFGFSGLATPIFKKAFHLVILISHDLPPFGIKTCLFWRNTNHPFLVLWRKGYFISTEVQQILLNLGFGGKANVLASSTGY